MEYTANYRTNKKLRNKKKDWSKNSIGSGTNKSMWNKNGTKIK